MAIVFGVSHIPHSEFSLISNNSDDLDEISVSINYFRRQCFERGEITRFIHARLATLCSIYGNGQFAIKFRSFLRRLTRFGFVLL
jgi:hypothetical protein